jgi:hypothetical protein
MLHNEPTLPIDATLPMLPKLVVGQLQGVAVPLAMPAAHRDLSLAN